MSLRSFFKMMVRSTLGRYPIAQRTAQLSAALSPKLEIWYQQAEGDHGPVIRFGVELLLDSNATSGYVNSSSMVPWREDGIDGTPR